MPLRKEKLIKDELLIKSLFFPLCQIRVYARVFLCCETLSHGVTSCSLSSEIST